MLDVHVLQLSSTPREVYKRCLDSIEAAMIPGVSVHFLQGIEGDMGTARYHAFRRGHQPYVGYIDDDDAVDPTIFSKILAVLEQAPDAVFTQERVIHPDGRVVEHTLPHNMVVVKRELALAVPYKKLNTMGDQALRASLMGKNVITIPEPLYHYYPTGRSLEYRS